jgi:hypothetical protein
MKKLLLILPLLIVGFVQANEPAPVDSPMISFMEIDKKTGIHVYCVSGNVFISQGKELPMTQVRYIHIRNGEKFLRCDDYWLQWRVKKELSIKK